MRNFARIENGRAVEMFDLDEHHPDAPGIEGIFHHSMQWIAAPAGCAEGWVLLDGILRAPADYRVLRAQTPEYQNYGEQLGALVKAVQALAAGQTIPPDVQAVLDGIDAVKVKIPKA